MREDLLCELKGRVIGKDKKPLKGKAVEFLPSVPWFHADGKDYSPIGAKTVTDDDGWFTTMLTRTDLTKVRYLTRGACGNYLIELNGPGPHLLGTVLNGAKRTQPLSHDS